MLSLRDDLVLKTIAWAVHFLAYPLWLILKVFVNEKSDRVQAPQHPRTIVITGASQGIGEGLVEHYYRHCSSCRTIVMISRSREKLQQVKDRLRDQPGKELVIYPCDVIDETQMKEILREIHQSYGPIDILFANAGVSFRQRALSTSMDQAVRDTFMVNIAGVINTVMPLIEIKGVRQIAIVSSQAAYAPCVSPIYGATKQCVLLLGRDLRRMLAKDNIAVNIISPGPVKTPMLVGTYQRAMEHGVSTAEAAEIVFQGLRRNQAEVVFPPMTGIFQYVLGYLPLSVAETIASYALKNK